MVASQARKWMHFCVIVIALSSLAAILSHSRNADGGAGTATPIKHLIVIIGENRTFDHVFGVYKPRPGQSV